jgi:von Hippel-Lindau disease tumor supressor
MKKTGLAFSILIMFVALAVCNNTKGEATHRIASSLINHLNVSESETSASDASCEKESTLRSKEGVDPVEFTLINRSKNTIVLYWLDYEGKRVKYEEIAPGLQVKQPTYLTHPWVVTDTKGRCLRILTPPGNFVIE